jgi:hypothetical protein
LLAKENSHSRWFVVNKTSIAPGLEQLVFELNELGCDATSDMELVKIQA